MPTPRLKKLLQRRRKSVEQILAPQMTHRDLERELCKMMPRSLEWVEEAVGRMYGHAFRLAEAAYAARGSKGRHPW